MEQEKFEFYFLVNCSFVLKNGISGEESVLLGSHSYLPSRFDLQRVTSKIQEVTGAAIVRIRCISPLGEGFETITEETAGIERNDVPQPVDIMSPRNETEAQELS